MKIEIYVCGGWFAERPKDGLGRVVRHIPNLIFYDKKQAERWIEDRLRETQATLSERLPNQAFARAYESNRLLTENTGALYATDQGYLRVAQFTRRKYEIEISALELLAGEAE